MRSKLGWLIVAVLTLALVGIVFFFGNRWGWPYGMHGYGMMGRGFGWAMPFWGILMVLVMASPILLLVALFAAIFYAAGRATSPPPSTQAVCPGCAQPVQPGWRICPNCETRLLAPAP